MRILAVLEYCVVIAGVVAVIAGQTLALPKGLHVGVFLIGAGIVLGGLESVFTRQVSFRFSSYAEADYEGTPAVICGLMALLVGTAIIASAYLLAEGLWQTTVNYLMRRPSPALAALGLLATGAGALFMLDPSGRSGVWWILLVRVPKVVVGFVLFAAGLAGIGLGVWEWFEPGVFDRLARSALERFDLRALDPLWGRLSGLLR